MATTTNPNTLAGKLVSIMSEVGPIQKTGWNGFHKYYYLKEEDIINAVRPLLTKHGVAIVPNVVEEHVIERKDGRETLSRLRVEFTFVDIETEQQITVTSVGHGTDAGDKAAYKALTGALKYALRQTFMISEGGEDPEADEAGDARRAQDAYERPEQVVITPSEIAGVSRGGRNTYPNKVQIEQLREQAKAAGLSVAGLATLIATVHGDEIDISDPATAGMAIQTYLTSGDANRVTALTRALLESQRQLTLVPEEPDNGDAPFTVE